MQLEKIKSAYPTFLLVISLIAGSLFTTYLIATLGPLIAPVVVVGFGGLFMAGLMFREYKLGIYFVLVLSVFMSFISRMLGLEFPFGIVIDGVCGLVFVIMLFSKRETDWSHLNSGITYMYVVLVVYQLLQIFNPNAVSYTAWLVAQRANAFFLLFFALYHLFQSFEEIKRFTMLWIALAALVAFYGIYQEMFGLNAKEHQWVFNNPARASLYLIWGHLRKFSFLSDPSAYGLFMAFSALACFILTLGPFTTRYRLLFGSLCLTMLVAMSFSGTRTATAMVAVGIAFYVLITLKSRRTLIVMMVAGVGMLAILFGPFHNRTVKRVRSTFQVSEDASMGVRDQKRIRLQEYVQSHPFGGGLNTTGTNGLRYSAGHPLAEGWDPDSGYLLTALELGWVGLLLAFGFFFTVVLKGINNYFSIRDPLVRTINLAYIVPFFAMSVAHYTQDAIFTKPQIVVILAAYAAMLRLPSFEKSIK